MTLPRMILADPRIARLITLIRAALRPPAAPTRTRPRATVSCSVATAGTSNGKRSNKLTNGLMGQVSWKE